ncbi:response regulator [Flavobacterium sangjuense]|uniref:Chemotaxis response regulator protein-glutamate methylesterase n=1 Tax=Flavobacterium sangjuense TaxID=2518177 RepID=A0A4P7PUR7_9FLAO|nr:response regulator [Flavobacterium sangjuense]QBZ97992.1 Chemotaxis response regulator protein-glutamate methylesterase [Flavobacterium sangjuense]
MLDKILCVDDDPITLMLCRKVVERVEFAKEIITAKNGVEAIDYFDALFEERKVNDSIVYPKLVLLDLNMPVMDGWEFLETYMRKRYDNVFTSTRFIVLSSSIDPYDINRSKTYPVIGFLSKPITKEMLENLKTQFP